MSQKKILLVEDNEFNRKIVRDLLARQPYDLLEAYDGEEGVAAARQMNADVALSRVQLPRMSGLDATRQIRAEPETSKIPIIVVTSFALSGDDKKAMDAGASAYLAKPYSPRQLLETIRKWVGDA